MAHPQQASFVLSVKNRFPKHFHKCLVLDLGSLDINGSNAGIFDDCCYLGVDVAVGPNVDVVCRAHELALPNETFDVVISTEMLEHDMFYPASLQNMVRLLKPGGLLVISCATTGRPEHGTRRTTPGDAPLLQGLDEWADYYKNLSESDLRAALDVDAHFEHFSFSTCDHPADLYFWGVKRGTWERRDDYSFNRVGARFAQQSRFDEKLSTIAKGLQTIDNSLKQQGDLKRTLADVLDSINGKVGLVASTIEALGNGAAARLDAMEQRASASEVCAERYLELASRSHALSERLGEITAKALANDSAQAELVETREDLAKSVAQVSRRIEEAKHYEQAAAGLREEIEALQLQLDQAESAVRSVSSELRAVQHQLEAERLEGRAALRQNSELKATATSLSLRVARVERERDLLRSRLASVEDGRDAALRRVEAFERSRSWRATEPMRRLAAAVRGQPAVYGLAQGVFRAARRRQNAAQTESGSLPQASTRKALFDLRASSHCVILTTKHCEYIAHLIVSCLARVGVSARIQLGPDEAAVYEDVPYFVICPQIFSKLPGLYVAFQMEQSVSSRWFNEEYIRRLENSYAIFDYSLKNVEFLQACGLSYRQIYYLPIGFNRGIAREIQDGADRDIDVLFYGDPTSPRRRALLGELSKHVQVHVASEVFGADLYDLIDRSKVIVNLHYYEGALLETTRLTEALSRGAIVVSEDTHDVDEHIQYHSIVDFVPSGDVCRIAECVKAWVDAPEARRAQRRQAVRTYIQNGASDFDFYFGRFLLASGNVTFEQFYEAYGQEYSLPDSHVLCLSLPESVERRREFVAGVGQKVPIFPGLRHELGWIGCGLSYKFLAKKAIDKGLQQITICEDDVEFSGDWEKGVTAVQSYLNRLDRPWHFFCGMAANLSERTLVDRVDEKDGLTFVHMNTMTSTVFTVFSYDGCELLQSWRESNFDHDRNTIDRFIESQPGITVITTMPFFVGHKEDQRSTLWGFVNSTYEEMTAKSRALLQRRIESYRSAQTAVERANA